MPTLQELFAQQLSNAMAAPPTTASNAPADLAARFSLELNKNLEGEFGQAWEQGPYAQEAYMLSLKAASGDVTRQVQMALEEIARQKQIAQQQAALLPGAAAEVYGDARSQYEADLAGTGMAPSAAVLAAMQGNQQGLADSAGLYSQGFEEQAVQRTGTTKMTEQEMLADLKAQAYGYTSDRSREDRGRLHDERESARSRSLQERIAQDQASLQQRLLDFQAQEAAETRQFQADQAAADRAAQQSLTSLLLQPLPQPAPYQFQMPAPSPQPAPRPRATKTYASLGSR